MEVKIIKSKKYTKVRNWSEIAAMLTVVRCIHLIAERKAICSVEFGAVLRRVEQWFVKQVWEAADQEALVCTIGVVTTNFQVTNHAIEYIHRRL